MRTKEKIKIKAIAALIVTCLVLTLNTGCHNMEETDSPSDDKSQEICEISIENIILGDKNTDLARIEALANEITVPAIGCKIKIIDCDISEHEDLMKKIQAGIEQIDLVETGLTTSLSDLVSSGTIIPLEGLLHEYGSELEEKEAEQLQAAMINQHIYAVPANLHCGRAEGIGYNANIAKKYGISMPDEVNLEILTQVGQILHDSGSGIYLTSQGAGNLTAFDSFYDMETFGGDFDYGVIMDPLNNTNIVNVYETSEYRYYCYILKQWKDNGYMPSDSLISGRNQQDMFNNGETFFQFSSISPGTELMNTNKNLSFSEEYIPITENRLTTKLVQEFAWGITSGCKYPEKAMELLNLIYTNGELANLLQYGIEGEDYTVVGDGKIRPVTNEDGTTSHNTKFTIYGDTVQKYHYESDSDITIEDVEEYSEQSQAGKTFGYVFQTDSVAMQIQKVQNVVNEYRPILETGMADDVDQLLDEFIAELKKAGIDAIIKENQRQLDSWLEAAKSNY